MPRASAESRIARSRGRAKGTAISSRTRDGRPLPYQPGLAWIAARTRAPVVPVTILGLFDLWPAGRALPDPGPIKVVFHPPIVLDPAECEARKRDPDFYQGILDRVRSAITSAYGPDGRCVYPRGY